MGKFIVFVVALCLIQGLYSTVAQTQEEIDMQSIVEIVGQFAKEIEETVKELPKRLPKIIKELQESIQTIVEDLKIVEIFENLKEEIENTVGKKNSKASCSKQAFDKLDDLNEKTSKDIVECLHEAQLHAEEIKSKMEGLMAGANVLAVDVAKRMETCVKSFGEDVAGLSTCLQSEIEAIKESLSQMKVTITETVDVSESLSQETSVKLKTCMDNVKQNAYNNSNKVLNAVQNCMEEL